MTSIAAAPRASISTTGRIILASVGTALVLAGATYLGQVTQEAFDLSGRARQAVHAVVMSVGVLSLIWWLRARVEGRDIASVGFEFSRRSLGMFAIGFGFIALPVVLVVATSRLFGWATIVVDTTPAGLSAFAIGLATVLLFEAVPEEIAVRGYIYRNLGAALPRWKASVLAVLSFLALPLLAVPIQHYLLGMEIRVNGAATIEPSYLIIMLIFGSFLQYLRVLSGTIWIGVGFHASFVLINRIMGPRESQMIRFVDATNESAVQLVALGTLVLILAVLFAWPWLAKRSLGWREIDSE